MPSTPSATCKTFNHKIEVYKRPAGSASYDINPIATWLFKGHIDSNGKCQVAQKVNTVYLDSSEVYATIDPPSSGTDRYRVLSYPVYNGNVLTTELGVGFDSWAR